MSEPILMTFCTNFSERLHGCFGLAYKHLGLRLYIYTYISMMTLPNVNFKVRVQIIDVPVIDAWLKPILVTFVQPFWETLRMFLFGLNTLFRTDKHVRISISEPNFHCG